MKLTNLALNALFGYYFARVVNILAQFRIKCLNLPRVSKMSAGKKWVNNWRLYQDRSFEDSYGKNVPKVKIFAKI